jgi:hypothetical protein
LFTCCGKELREWRLHALEIVVNQEKLLFKTPLDSPEMLVIAERESLEATKKRFLWVGHSCSLDEGLHLVPNSTHARNEHCDGILCYTSEENLTSRKNKGKTFEQLPLDLIAGLVKGLLNSSVCLMSLAQQKWKSKWSSCNGPGKVFASVPCAENA